MEVSMSEAEELLALLVDHLQDGVWLLDADSAAIVEVSRSGSVQVGSRASTLLETNFCSLIEPEMTSEAWQLLLAQIPTAGSHTLAVGIRSAIGYVQAVDLTLTRDHSCGPQHERILAITRSQIPEADLSGAQRPELTGDLETLLDATLEALGEGVAILDQLGRVEKANSAFLELVDLQQSLVLDHSMFDPPWIWQSVQGDFIEIEDTPPVQALRTGKAQRLEHVQLRGNGLNRTLGDLI